MNLSNMNSYKNLILKLQNALIVKQKKSKIHDDIYFLNY
jgi:hypothetical protein